MIPKIIHYCWLSGDPIPEKLQKCMDSWKKKLPDYEFMLWDLNRFDISKSLWVKQAFAAKKYAFAADYIRLYAIYHYGGIYLDMDIEVIKSFNDLLQQNYILGYEKAEGIEAGVFGSVPKAKWVKLCLDYYQNKSFITPNGNMNTRPLPKIMYNIFLENGMLNNELFPWPPEYFTAKSYQTGEIFQTSNTYCIHHFAGSWHGPKERIYKLVSNVLGKKFAAFCSKVYKLLKASF